MLIIIVLKMIMVREEPLLSCITMKNHMEVGVPQTRELWNIHLVLITHIRNILETCQCNRSPPLTLWINIISTVSSSKIMTMMISLNNNMSCSYRRITKVLLMLIKPEEVVYPGLSQRHLKDQEAEVQTRIKDKTRSVLFKPQHHKPRERSTKKCRYSNLNNSSIPQSMLTSHKVHLLRKWQRKWSRWLTV